MVKRLFDIVVSLVLLLVFLPVFLLVALGIKIGMPGPVFFLQTRVGMGRRLFRMVKFRSMVVDAEQKGGHSTQSGDVRVTGVGRFLRQTSLDELPQLFNVLVGDMSLVGPRPDVPAQEVGYREEDWVKRHRVRPGITGLAQALMRSDATVEQRLQMDLDYVDKTSLWFDLWVLWLTVKRVVGMKGGN